jgi:hypothetical protein
MNTQIAKSVEDIEALRPLAEEWSASCNCGKFGLEADINIFLSGLMDLVDGDGSDLLILKSDDKPIGFMGLTTFKSPFGKELIGNEHYWFVRPGSNGKASLKLISKAQLWAKEKGCSHIIMNASMAASSLHAKVCGFYERLKFTKFETSYIKEIL